MHRELAEKRSRGEFAFRCARKRDRDERHEKMNQRAVQNAAHERVRDEHWEVSAGRVVNDRRRERDQEMEEEAERSRSLSAFERNFAHRSARDELQKPLERAAFRNKKRRRAREIKHSANGTCDGNHDDGIQRFLLIRVPSFVTSLSCPLTCFLSLVSSIRCASHSDAHNQTVDGEIRKSAVLSSYPYQALLFAD
jgi:hypothetical protein